MPLVNQSCGRGSPRSARPTRTSSRTTAARKATCSTLPASTRIETLADDENFTFRGTEAFTAAGQINTRRCR